MSDVSARNMVTVAWRFLFVVPVKMWLRYPVHVAMTGLFRVSVGPATLKNLMSAAVEPVLKPDAVPFAECSVVVAACRAVIFVVCVVFTATAAAVAESMSRIFLPSVPAVEYGSVVE